LCGAKPAAYSLPGVDCTVREDEINDDTTTFRVANLVAAVIGAQSEAAKAIWRMKSFAGVQTNTIAFFENDLWSG